MLGGGSSDSRFTYSAVIFAVAVLFLMPTLFNVFVGTSDDADADDRAEELLNGYRNFTGATTAISQEQPWILTSITTPYLGGSYTYSPDGWLYGAQIGVDADYIPSQYTDSVYNASAVRYNPDKGAYYYTADTYDGHKAGDLYTAVTMDVNQKSNIFFTHENKTMAGGGYFYYQHNGYRYSFSSLSEYDTIDENGDLVPVTRTSSLSVIWYSYYNIAEGIAGQLILENDRGTAFLTSNEIVAAFNSANNTSKFTMNFNGVEMFIYVRISPYYSQFMSIEECWNAGYWELMVSSPSVNTSTYLNADYSFNVYEIWDTFIDLFTFNTDKYGLDGPVGTVCSLVMCVPMYALLISLGLSCYPLLIVAGVVAAVQAISTAVSAWDWGGWL